ncbi:MAG: hypothetical protein K0S09_1827 [Sphingobacteriaceae bacterium]|jgi:hypothetical protein|nr:hypothetical protein [Sphingobacteriaceae bacterium]
MGIQKTLKATALTSVAILWGVGTNAQGVFIGTNGLDVQISGKTYEDIQGSPYLNESWSDGLITLTDGSSYRTKLNFDQVNEHVLFLKDGNTYLLQTPIKQFEIQAFDGSRRKFLNGFPETAKDADKSTFYELLVDGDAKLLKRVKKKIVEERGSGSILPSKQIQTANEYYAYIDGGMVQLTDNKSVYKALAAKGDVQKFSLENKLNLKREDDLRRVFKHFE